MRLIAAIGIRKCALVVKRGSSISLKEGEGEGGGQENIVTGYFWAAPQARMDNRTLHLPHEMEVLVGQHPKDTHVP